MPELPEVEMIKQVIEPQIQGLTIQAVTVSRREVIAHPSANEFCSLLAGQVISHMERRGKFLTVILKSGDYIVLHLRMTGCLLVTPPDYPQEKHTHVVFELNNGEQLRFSDTRRFGRFWLIENSQIDTYSGINKLGIEPFSPEFSAKYLTDRLGKRKKTIKECLLDQSVIAGIGNIYSDEILFAAKISPDCPASCLKNESWVRLAQAIPERLAFFIEKNNSAPKEYQETKGQHYRSTPFLQVYGCEGKPCPICGNTLCRKVIGSRSSTYCPCCQNT